MDEKGNAVEAGSRGLLLFYGGTMCDDGFDDYAADAICRDMGNPGSINWSTDDSFSIQQNLDITLDNVECPSADWSTCTYSKSNNCGHSEDIFLSCRSGAQFSSKVALYLFLMVYYLYRTPSL